VMLARVSRSFTLVINQLENELRDPICIFYLVLRGLDSIEDDTAVASEKRIKDLRVFADHLQERGWNISGYGRNANEILLLEHFDKVIDIYLQLKPEYRRVITEVTQKMSEGMIECISNNYAMETVKQYDLYCHYVAGLVGIGLTKMFFASGLENKTKDSHVQIVAPVGGVEDDSKLIEQSNSMGLFLQKVNIIRDYLEDLSEDRVFWPKEIWAKHSPTGKLSDFARPEYHRRGVECVKELILNALSHIPDCFSYLESINNPANFRFCSIPQVMAIATLSECLCNEKLFHSATKPVKIRTGLSALILLQAKDMASTKKLFARFLDVMVSKLEYNNHQQPGSSIVNPLDRALYESITSIRPLTCISSPSSSPSSSSFVEDLSTAPFIAATQIGCTIAAAGLIFLR
jgi:farnesyl-diphosphate farnesyltransferase